MPPKKSMANKNQKLLRLYGILMFSGVEHSLSSLARRLECSKQTVLRYIDDLEMSAKGELIRRIGENGQAYYKMKAPNVKPHVALSAEHIQHLLMCHDLLTHLLPGGMMGEVADVIGHTTVLLDNFEERDKALKSMFTVKPAEGKIDYSHYESIITTLKSGIAQSKICNIAYESSMGCKPIALAIAPLVLFSYKGGLYIKVRKIEWKESGLVFLSIGRITGTFHPKPRETEVLAVHRIVDVSLTGNEFRPEPQRTKNTEEIFGMGLEEPFRVRVTFSPLVADYIRKRTWSSNQEIAEHEDGSLTLSMMAGNRDEVFSWLLSFGMQAQVFEPQEMRQKMFTHANELSDLYMPERNEWHDSL